MDVGHKVNGFLSRCCFNLLPQFRVDRPTMAIDIGIGEVVFSVSFDSKSKSKSITRATRDWLRVTDPSALRLLTTLPLLTRTGTLPPHNSREGCCDANRCGNAVFHAKGGAV